MVLLATNSSPFPLPKVIQEGWSMSNVWRDTLLLLRALFNVSLILCRMRRKVSCKVPCERGEDIIQWIGFVGCIGVLLLKKRGLRLHVRF